MNLQTGLSRPDGKNCRAGLISLLWLAGAHFACANPTNGQLVSGSASITSVPGTLTVNQTTTSAIINWQSFSINTGELTQFKVPNTTSATLNRVTGGDVSAIYGTLQSNGQLYLLNPNGILVGPSGRIDTAGFVGSTLSLSDAEFEKRASLNFSGASTAGVTNQGTIHTGMGDVYLIGTQVENSGTIEAPNGTVGLAAGSQVLLQTAGDQHLFVQAGGSSTAKSTGVKNSGNIVSAAVELKAAGGNAYAMAINNSGNITATGITQIDGQIYLTAPGGNITNSGKISAKNANGNGGKVVINAHGTDGTTKGSALNSGIITATGTAPGTTGGTVELLGDKVGVVDHGMVDVSGEAGGGTALIGGDEHGSNPDVVDADQTYVGPDATVAANALTLGNGGKIILWANDTTQAYGHLSVRGGAQGGNGGFVETSAAQLKAETAPDLSAPHGMGGTWLLDPSTVVISDDGTATVSQSTLQTTLAGGSVTIDASLGTGGNGTITWRQPNNTPFDISGISGATLTLNAPGQILLNGITIHSSNGSGNLSLAFNSNPDITKGNVSIQGSTLSLNGGSFTATGNGYISNSDAAFDPNGIDIANSTINAQGGAVSLTGNGGYVFNSGLGGLSAGAGLSVFNSTVETTGTGAFSLSGTFAQNIISLTSMTGVSLTGTSTLIQADNPTGGLAISGTVSLGTAGTSTLGASISGVSIGNGAQVKTTVDGGSISITGNASGSTSVNATTGGGGNEGIELGQYSGPTGSLISVTTNGSLTLNGTAGTIDNSFVTNQNNTSEAPGVKIDNGMQVTAGDNSTISITGQGGQSVTSGLYSAGAKGVTIGNDPNGGMVTVAVGTAGSITITGTGGTANTTTAAASTHLSGVEGVNVDSNSKISATGTSTIFITGTGGTVTSGVNQVGSAPGVLITSGIQNSKPSLVASGSGAITITGTGGFGPNADVGVAIIGFNGQSASVTSGSGQINITGTGGSGYTGPATITGSQIPSYGIGLVDDANIQTTSGSINMTGAGGSGAAGVIAIELPTGGFDPTPVPSTINAGSGTLQINGLTAADAVDLTGIISGRDVLVNSTSINLTGATVTTTDPGIPQFSQGLKLVDNFTGATGQINITTSTITGSSMLIGYYSAFSFDGGGNAVSQVSINHSVLHLTLGANPAGTSLFMQIAGTAATAGSPGVSITNGSTITEDDGDVEITGTGLLASGSDAIGVQIANSTLTVGSVATPGNGTLDIQGYSDTGTTTLTPNVTFANNSYGVQLTSSTLTSHATNQLKIHGTSYAANNLNAYGTYINGGAILVTTGTAKIKGRVKPESFTPDSGSSSGEANFISGVYTVGGAQITANGAKANITIDGSTKKTTATDNGISSIAVRNVGVNLTDGTLISAAGDGLIADGNIAIIGDAGASISSLSNTLNTDSIGVWLHENSGGTGLGGTISNSGLGGIALGGLGGNATGPNVYSGGVVIGDSNEVAAYVTATNGGYIALGGLGGTVSPDLEGTSFNASNIGVLLNNGHVSTTSGVIALFGLAGQVSATPPVGSTIDSAGVGVTGGSTVTTNLTSAGAQSHNGIVIPPTILLYGSNGGINTTNPASFVPGTGGFAVQEDSTSSLTTENLVMGNFYGLISAFATPAQLAKLTPTVQTNVMNFITNHNVMFNPTGTISLTSASNQITNLDSAWVGTGGLNLVDSISLTVDPIGGTDNTNYGQIDLPANGPVFIQTAGDLILTSVSPITGQASTQPVIATEGTGDNITLVAGGAFLNLASPSIPALTLTNGAVYHLYLNSNFIDSSQLGNLTSPDNVVGNSPYPTSISATGNVIAYSGDIGPSHSTMPTPPGVTTQTALDNIPLPKILDDITHDTDVKGGAGGVATLKGRKLPPGTIQAAIVKNDLKDGSTVNTGTLLFKWATNTGLSKLLLAGEDAYIGLGTTGPGIPDPFILALFPGVTNPPAQADLGAAVFGHVRPPGADIVHGPAGNH